MSTRQHIAILLAVLTCLACGCKTAEYRKGYAQGVAEATSEISSNTLTIYMYGTHPVPTPTDLNDDQTGLPIKFIAGCIVSDNDMGRAEGHNMTIREHLSKDAP